MELEGSHEKPYTFYGDGSGLTGTAPSRVIVSGATTSIVNSGIGNTDITGFKSYMLMRVGLSTAGWFRLYTDSASRANDTNRSVGEDPLPGSGVIAEVVATVLLDNTYNGEIIEVTGPELITFKEIVNIISKTSNRRLNFYDITLEQYIKGMKQMQIPDDVVWLIEYLFSHVLTNPKNQLVVNDIERVLGRKAKTFLEKIN